MLRPSLRPVLRLRLAAASSAAVGILGASTAEGKDAPYASDEGFGGPSAGEERSIAGEAGGNDGTIRFDYGKDVGFGF